MWSMKCSRNINCTLELWLLPLSITINTSEDTCPALWVYEHKRYMFNKIVTTTQHRRWTLMTYRHVTSICTVIPLAGVALKKENCLIPWQKILVWFLERDNRTRQMVCHTETWHFQAVDWTTILFFSVFKRLTSTTQNNNKHCAVLQSLVLFWPELAASMLTSRW